MKTLNEEEFYGRYLRNERVIALIDSFLVKREGNEHTQHEASLNASSSGSANASSSRNPSPAIEAIE